MIGEQVDVAFGLTELVVGERVEPIGDFGFELDRSPRYSSDAITCDLSLRGELSATRSTRRRIPPVGCEPAVSDGRMPMVDRYTVWTDWTDQTDQTDE